MDVHEFSKAFSKKSVRVFLENGKTVNGKVMEIGLSVNLNVDSCERLPVSMKVDNTNISLPDIQQIEFI